MSSNNQYFPVIVVVCYNRTESLCRLLHSISNAVYPNNEVELYISIDKGDKQDEIVDIATDFIWQHGNKTIIKHPSRQGLRKHILQCGDLTEKFKSVIILEDDLTVSRAFYLYSIQALRYYSSDHSVGGISLYSYNYNPYVGKPFIPANNGYDVYQIQVAMSWGQCWTYDMWKEFRKWHHVNDILPSDGMLPNIVTKWDNRSWLKFYDRYLVDMGKFFIMPYTSLSTNHSDIGEHAKLSSCMFEVPLFEDIQDFRFPSSGSAIKYDAFFERMGIEDQLVPMFDGKKILDLYGTKNNLLLADYVFSIQRLKYKVIDEYAIVKRPIEENCKFPIKGRGIYLYDMRVKSKKKPHDNTFFLLQYYLYNLDWRSSIKYSFWSLIRAFISKLMK